MPLALLAATYFLVNTGLIAARDRPRIGAPARSSSGGGTSCAWRRAMRRARRSRCCWSWRCSRSISPPSRCCRPPLLLVFYYTLRSSFGRLEDAKGHLDKLNTLYLSTVETLATAIDAKDEVTHGHIRRVQLGAMGLARELGVKDDGNAQGDRGRGAAPRHRQDRDPRAHPEQAGQAHAGRVRQDEAPRPDRRGDPLGDRLPLSGRADRPASPRELGRHRLSGSHRRHRHSDRRAHPVGRRLLRRAHVRSSRTASG